MKRKIIAVVLAVLALAVFANLGFSSESEEPTDMVGFLRAEGSEIVDGSGEPFFIKGMAFGNLIWSNPTRAPQTHHTEDCYRELSELGFNSVRFYLNYALFERDSHPFDYDFRGVAGWDWLDWNIQMARRYNIRLILNMHYPQGGYQSQSDGMGLWTERANQERLVALWREIAYRYKDEIAIGGFDLVNEPVVPRLGSVEESFAQWQDLAQEIAYAIREVNENHLIIVERLNAIKDMETGVSDWSPNMNGDMNYFLIDDPNVAYTFHFYDPHYFTHQNASWVESLRGTFATYPDETAMPIGNTSWEGATFNNPRLGSRRGWQELRGNLYRVNNRDFMYGRACVQVQGIGPNGRVWIDDIVVNEYDANRRFVRQIRAYDFNRNTSWGFWSADGNGGVTYTRDGGRNGSGGLLVSGTTSDANASDWSFNFFVRQGYHYEISGWLRGENVASNANVTFRVDFWSADEVGTLDFEFLEDTFSRFIAFGEENNVPLYLGEFGAISSSFEEDRGGERWVRDVIELCIRHGVHFNYHAYHEEAFGLYRNSPSVLPDNLNTALYEVFREMLREE